MIVLLEFDWRGSWRPRRNHVGALRRWICGPVSVAVLPGGFNDVMRAFRDQATEELMRHAVNRVLARERAAEMSAAGLAKRPGFP